jgi:hypothetical protein
MEMAFRPIRTSSALGTAGASAVLGAGARLQPFTTRSNPAMIAILEKKNVFIAFP